MKPALAVTLALFAAASYWAALLAAGDFGFRLGLGERPQIGLGLAHTVSYRADPKLPAIPALHVAVAAEATSETRPGPAESARQAAPAPGPSRVAAPPPAAVKRVPTPPQPVRSKSPEPRDGDRERSDSGGGD